MSEPRAWVHEIDGQMVLVDPDAVEVMKAVGKHNCRNTYSINIEAVDRFRGRVIDQGRSPAEVVIVILAVDDVGGGALASLLMPNYDWQAIRDRGEIPYARGMAGREGIESALKAIDTQAAEKLHTFDGLAVVVVDHGTAEIYPA
jgi:hypothetical protein